MKKKTLALLATLCFWPLLAIVPHIVGTYIYPLIVEHHNIQLSGASKAITTWTLGALFTMATLAAVMMVVLTSQLIYTEILKRLNN